MLPEQTVTEKYIPLTRHDLVEQLLAEGELPAVEAERFRAFCELLATYYHFQYHALLEELKESYAPFNPDRRVVVTAGQEEQSAPEDGAHEENADYLAEMEERFCTGLADVLVRGNYRELNEDAVREAMGKHSLINLRTEIDFGDIDRLLFFCRGESTMKGKFRRFYWQKQVTEMEVYDQVVLGIKYKDAIYFLMRHRDPKALEFTPGRLYLFSYRNIPKYDLELLFPHVRLNMTLRDRLMFWVPAVGAGASVLAKAIPNMLLIAGVIIFFTLGPEFASNMGVGHEQVNDLMPTLAALLSLAMGLGSFAFKQYSGYQNRRIKFMKDVTETLFFKNIATNLSVVHSLVDAAEEEETKEVILVYYQLLTAKVPLTVAELDERIEAWLRKKTGANVDFDLERTLADMQALQGEIQTATGEPAMRPLLWMDEAGRCHVLPLRQAKQLLDWKWDHAFAFHTPQEREPGVETNMGEVESQLA